MQKKRINYTKLTFWVISLGMILRFLLASTYRVSGDACWHLSIARFIGNSYTIPLFENLGRDSVFSRGPLFHMIAAAFYKVFGLFGNQAADFGMKMVSPLFGSLTLVLFYLLIKKYYDNRTTFIAVLIFTFFPLHIYYSTISYIDSTLAFSALLSVYLVSEKKLVLGSIVTGLSVMLKFEGLFMIPVLLLIISYQNRKDIMSFIKKSAIFGILSFAVYSPLLIRNYIYLGNPFWPFLVQIFGGHPVVEITYATASLSNIFNIFNVIAPYLELFGVPNGNYKLLFFVGIPLIKAVILVWLAATLVYSFFFIYGVTKCSRKKPADVFAIAWIGFFMLLLVGTIIFADIHLSRYLIASLPAIAVITSVGISNILKKKKYAAAIWTLLLAIIIGFVGVEFAKTSIASGSWEPYDMDFNWIKENTGPDSTIFYVGQCIAFNTERFSIYTTVPLTGEYVLPDRIDGLGETYAWINQDFRLEPQAILPEPAAMEIRKNYELVYSSDKTKTEVYKIKD